MRAVVLIYRMLKRYISSNDSSFLDCSLWTVKCSISLSIVLTLGHEMLTLCRQMLGFPKYVLTLCHESLALEPRVFEAMVHQNGHESAFIIVVNLRSDCSRHFFKYILLSTSKARSKNLKKITFN